MAVLPKVSRSKQLQNVALFASINRLPFKSSFLNSILGGTQNKHSGFMDRFLKLVPFLRMVSHRSKLTVYCLMMHAFFKYGWDLNLTHIIAVFSIVHFVLYRWQYCQKYLVPNNCKM